MGRPAREPAGGGRVGRPFVLLLACALGCGQASPSAPAPEQRLAAALVGLSAQVDPSEAASLAEVAFGTTAALRERYRPLAPPQLGNLAFHLGLRERALCCHWTEDLLGALSALRLRSLELRWGVAHRGSALREHSAVVAVPRGASFAQGLVLDAWRDSGRLYWTRADRDRYTWQPHPGDRAETRVVCARRGR